MEIRNTILKSKNLAVLVNNYNNSSIIDNYGINESKINEHKNIFSIGVWKRKIYKR